MMASFYMVLVLQVMLLKETTSVQMRQVRHRLVTPIRGISIENTASNNTIGGALATERNIISGNGSDGVYIENSSNNTVSGNYIGTDD